MKVRKYKWYFPAMLILLIAGVSLNKCRNQVQAHVGGDFSPRG